MKLRYITLKIIKRHLVTDTINKPYYVNGKPEYTQVLQYFEDGMWSTVDVSEVVEEVYL